MPFIATVLMSLMILGGCVMIPIRPPDEEPFSDNSVEPLKPDKATKVQVLQVLGKPSHTFAQQAFWIYSQDREMTKWLAIFAIPAGFGGYGDFEIFADQKQYWLVFQFDDEGTLMARHLLNESAPCIEGGELCFIAEQLELAEELPQPLGTPGPDSCSLIIYIKPYARETVQRQIWISETEKPVRKLLKGMHGSVYAKISLEPGNHSFTASSNSDEEVIEYTTFRCDRGSMQYFRVSFLGENGTNIQRVPEEVALSELEHRRLRLPQDWSLHSTLEIQDGCYVDPTSGQPFSGFWKITYFDDDTSDVLFLSDGLIVEQSVVKKTPDGGWEVTYPNQAHPDGLETMYYPSGRPSHQTRYMSGERDGLSFAWQPDGSVAYKECFRFGKKVPITECPQ
jgi:hypothetical protein